MTVHFIGAGPGAADLITVRGRDLLARCPVCLYAGSIVPPALLALCPPGARIVDTAPMSLDEIEAEYVRAHTAGEDVARLHSGDLSIYSALAEQLRRLERHGIPYTLTPGVPAFAAAAAALGSELTVPEVAQSVVLTRMPGRASAMPKTEQLAAFAATGATLAIHLAIPAIETIVRELIAVLRRRLSGRRGGARELAAGADPARHARRHRRQGRGRAHRAHRARSRRPRARRKGIPRQRALRSRLSAPVSLWRRLVIRGEGSMAHQQPVAVEHRDLDGDAAVRNGAQRRRPRGRRRPRRRARYRRQWHGRRLPRRYSMR